MFQTASNVRFSKLVYHLSIYSFYTQVIGMNISDSYVKNVHYSSSLNLWWSVLGFLPKFCVILSIIKYDLYIHLFTIVRSKWRLAKNMLLYWFISDNSVIIVDTWVTSKMVCYILFMSLLFVSIGFKMD